MVSCVQATGDLRGRAFAHVDRVPSRAAEVETLDAKRSGEFLHAVFLLNV